MRYRVTWESTAYGVLFPHTDREDMEFRSRRAAQSKYREDAPEGVTRVSLAVVTKNGPQVVLARDRRRWP